MEKRLRLTERFFFFKLVGLTAPHGMNEFLAKKLVRLTYFACISCNTTERYFRRIYPARLRSFINYVHIFRIDFSGMATCTVLYMPLVPFMCVV